MERSAAHASGWTRVLAATNKDLNRDWGRRFREDLYFRLNVIPIFSRAARFPSAADIPLPADHFMAMLAAEYGWRPKRFASECVGRGAFSSISGPAVRRDTANHAPVFDKDSGDPVKTIGDKGETTDRRFRFELAGTGPVVPLSEARDQFEKDYILHTLAAQQGNMSRTPKCSASNDRISTKSYGRSASLPGAAPELVFEDLIAREPFELQVVFDRLPERRGRHQTHDFTLQHAHAVAFRFALDEIEDAEDRRLLVVGEVH
jgi:hypothetical protein